MFEFYVLLVPLFGADGTVLYTNPGHSVTLPCFYDARVKYLSWYKQVAGEQPHIISSVYKHSPDSNSFHNQFKHDKRFSVHAGEGFYHLNISNVQDSDSAMYYCGKIIIVVPEFENGIFLDLKQSGHSSFPLQPVFDTMKPGGSVTPNCTVHADVGGLHFQPSVPECTTDSQNEEADALQYVSLDFKKRQSKSRTQRSTKEEEVIYSGVRPSDMK
ncbi:uncharacterized protein LOC127379540 isoform X2 [Dicentrarchus labrax]|uniref:uncharacterized protein LOC127379540 isoform X2 n=1 Tax=Dicentrarchus labrax TaxID=13489 RepID=UPI0021F5C693|nr:uncharacterized protein LOC127379540 isoform X2 [Dicentrarchus labrax]